MDLPKLTIEEARAATRHARECAHAGDADGARRHLAAALDRLPADIECHHIAGVTLSMLSDFDAALAQFDLALAIDPAFPYSLVDVANIHDACGRHPEAIAWYLRAAAAAPHWDLPRRRAAIAYSTIGAHDLAESLFAALVEAAPDDERLRHGRAANLAARDGKRNTEAFLAALPPRPSQTPPPAGWERVHIVCPEPVPGQGAAFDETIEGLAQGFHDLGSAVTIIHGPPAPTDAVTIIIGAHFLALRAQEPELPARCVLVNLEQMTSWSGQNPHYQRLLAHHPVWDYSPRNIAALRAKGVTNITLLRIGHASVLERVPAGVEPDIDILFYGAVNERRGHVLAQLEARGFSVKRLFNVFRDERDAWIARARLVLNVHFHDDHIFEIIRCSYLFANRKAVVSEIADDTEIEPDIREAIFGAPYDALPDACAALLAAPYERNRIAEHGARILRRRPQADLLREAIAATRFNP